MSAKLNKGEKPKAKFAQSNINHLYKGNAAETYSKPTLRAGGLQLVGKLQGTRRNPPPPPWMPSLKAEMGGHDTRVNIVPPGGSGWGSGPNTSASDTSTPVIQSEAKPSSILKDITKNKSKDSADTVTHSATSDNDQSASLVKPPQKPFFAPRPSKITTPKNLADSPPDLNTPTLVKSAGPAVPFYQRPAAPANLKPIDSPNKEDKSLPETSQVEIATSASNHSVLSHVGWAAVAAAEPDFQEQINFSDDEDDTESKQPLPEEKTWTASLQPSSQPSIKAIYPQTAWEPPVSNNKPGLLPIVAPFTTSYNRPNENNYQRPSIPIDHVSVVTESRPIHNMAAINDPLSVARAFNAMSMGVTESEVQAQREARTLEYKSAVSRAQMARKKHTSDSESDCRYHDVVSTGPPLLRNICETPTFSQSNIASNAASVFPGNPVIVPSIQQPNFESFLAAFAATYGTLIPSTSPNTSSQAPISQMKVPMTNSMLPPWGAQNPFSGSSQAPQFMQHQPSFPPPNSQKIPNQAYLHDALIETLIEVCQQQTSQGSQGQMMQNISSGASLEASQRSMDDINQYTNLNMQVPPPATSDYQRLPNKPEFRSSNPQKQFEHHQSDSGDTQHRLLLTVDNDSGDIHNRQQQVPVGTSKFTISAHADGSRTFTPPSNIYESSGQPQSQHITPLMEVDLSGKWSDKDFDVFSSHQSSYQQGPGSKILKITRSAYTSGTSRQIHNLATSDAPDHSIQSQSFSYPGNKSGRPKDYASKDVKKPRNYRYDDQSTQDIALGSTEFTHEHKKCDDSQFEGEEHQTYDLKSTKSYNRVRRGGGSENASRSGGYSQTAFSANDPCSNEGGSGGGTLPHIQRGGGGIGGGGRGASGSRFTRSGRNAEIEDYCGLTGFPNNGKSSTAATNDSSPPCYEGDSTRQRQLASYPREKRKGQGYREMTQRSDIMERSHRDQPKGKPVSNFSRSGGPSSRRFPVHAGENSEALQHYSNSMPRDHQQEKADKRRMNGGEGNDGNKNVASETNERRFQNRKINSRNASSQQQQCPKNRRNGRAPETGDMHISSTTDCSENNNQHSATSKTTAHTIDAVKKQDSCAPQNDHDADLDTSVYRHSAARRGGGKPGIRSRRLPGGKYRQAAQQPQFRSDYNVHPRHDLINRHPDDDEDDEHRDGIGSGSGSNTFGSSAQNLNNVTYSTGGDVSGETTGTTTEPTQTGSVNDTCNHKKANDSTDSAVNNSSTVLPLGKDGEGMMACRKNGVGLGGGGAHSVTSDVEVWETASEGASNPNDGLNSSILGESQNSSNCSFEECRPSQEVDSTEPEVQLVPSVDHQARQDASNMMTSSHTPGNALELEDTCSDGGSYGSGYQSRRVGSSFKFSSNRSRTFVPEDVSPIVPLMSINAKAPPSFRDATFFDSPSDSSDVTIETPTRFSKPCVDVDAIDDLNIKLDCVDDVASVASSVKASSDGFMEVRSKSSKKQRQKNQAREASKDKKPSSSHSDDRPKDMKNQGEKNRSLPQVSPKTEAKVSKHLTMEVSPKAKPTANSTGKTPHRKLDDKKSKVPVTNAWSKPLQASIKAPEKSTTLTFVSEESKLDSTKTSYAWSKVVGSRVGASAEKTLAGIVDAVKTDVSSINGSVSNSPKRVKAHSPPKQLSRNVEPNTLPQKPVIDSINVKQSPPLSSEQEMKDNFEFSPLWLETDKKSFGTRPSFHSSTANGGLRSGVTITSSSGSSANVCKVRPQKQPQPPTAPVCSYNPLTQPQTTTTKACVVVSSRQSDAIIANLTASSSAPLAQAFSSGQCSQMVQSSSEYSHFPSQQPQTAFSKPQQTIQKKQYAYEPSAGDMIPVSWPLFSKSYPTNQMLNTPLSSANLPLDVNFYLSDQIMAEKNRQISESDSISAPPMYLAQHPAPSPFRHSFQPMSVGQQPQGSIFGLGINDLQRHANVRVSSQNDNYFQAFAAAPAHSNTVQPKELYSLMQSQTASRNFAQWQQTALENAHQHTEQPSNALLVTTPHPHPGPPMWSTHFGPNYHQHQPQQPTQHGHGLTPIVSNTYVGVIGGDRPSSTLIQNRMTAVHSNQSSIYETAPSPQHSLRGPPMPSNQNFLSNGLYTGAVASSPTPPPQHTHNGINPFDPNFAYASGISGAPSHSSSPYSPNSAGPRHHQLHNHHPFNGSSSSRLRGSEMPPPTQQAVFINPQVGTYTLQVPVAASAGTHSGLHF